MPLLDRSADKDVGLDVFRESVVDGSLPSKTRERARAMVQEELIRRIAGQTGLRLRDVKTTLDALGHQIAGLAPTEEIRTTAIGTFWVSHQKARPVRNPQTGEALELEPRNVVLFKAAKHVRDALNMR